MEKKGYYVYLENYNKSIEKLSLVLASVKSLLQLSQWCIDWRLYWDCGCESTAFKKCSNAIVITVQIFILFFLWHIPSIPKRLKLTQKLLKTKLKVTFWIIKSQPKNKKIHSKKKTTETKTELKTKRQIEIQIITNWKMYNNYNNYNNSDFNTVQRWNDIRKGLREVTVATFQSGKGE